MLNVFEDVHGGKIERRCTIASDDQPHTSASSCQQRAQYQDPRPPTREQNPPASNQLLPPNQTSSDPYHPRGLGDWTRGHRSVGSEARACALACCRGPAGRSSTCPRARNRSRDRRPSRRLRRTQVGVNSRRTPTSWPRGPLYRRAFDSSQHRTSTLPVDQQSTREATRWRPPLPFLPDFSLRWHCDSLTKSAGHDFINHFCQADRLIVRGFIAGIAATPWKGVCAPATSSDPESGKRRKGNRERCGCRIAGNQPDARARNGAGLQLAVEAVALDSIDVERCVQLREQRQREVVQRAKPFWIRDTRVGFRWWPIRTPSIHRFLAPGASTRPLIDSVSRHCEGTPASRLPTAPKVGQRRGEERYRAVPKA